MFHRVLATGLALLCSATLATAETEEDREGGIIGTGIVGEITALGSIYVNDQHIEIDAQMPIAGAVPDALAGDLQPGETVAVIATPEGGDWRARHIRQILPLVGPVAEVGDGALTVMGVYVAHETLTSMPQPGDWVAISGQWRMDGLHASKIQVLQQRPETAQISGSWLGPDSGEAHRIGTARIEGLSPEHLERGDAVRVFGQPTPDGLQVERLERGLFDQNVGLVLVEGYFSPPQPDGLYTVLGSGLIAYTERPEMIMQDSLVRQCGRNGALGQDEMSGRERRLAERLGCEP